MSNGVEFNGPIGGRNVVAGPVTHAGATSNFNFYSSGAAERGSSPVPKPHSTVPFPPDPHFVDRPDIIEWMQQKDTEPAARMALVGLGGIGKSQLAIHYAHVVRNRAPNTWVFWVHGGTTERFQQAYHDIADTLHLPGRKDPNTDILKLVYKWLCSEDNGRWLMILDNADDMAVFYSSQPQLATFLPQSRNGSLVMTSRNIDVAQRLTGHYHNILKIPVMDEDQIRQLLREKLEINYEDDDVAAKLGRALDHMPLALTQAAAFINRRAPLMTMSKYLRELDGSGNMKGSLLDRDSGDLRRDASASNSIVKTWQITFEQVRREQPSAADLLALMSFFNPQSIGDWVLRDSIQKTDGAESTFDDDIAVLRGYSLVNVTEDGRVFEMHPLVQHCTRVWLTAMSKIEAWRGKFVMAMQGLYPLGEYENWDVCRELEPHIANQLVEERPQDDGAAVNWAGLLSNAASYRRTMGRYNEAEQMCRRALDVEMAVCGPEHEFTLASMSNLAVACLTVDKTGEAEQLLRKTLESRRRRIRGEKHPHTLTDMYNLGVALGKLDRHDEAEQLLRQVLEMRRKALGEDHQETLSATGALALTMYSLGRYEEAKRLQQQTLQKIIKVNGRAHPRTLIARVNLAATLDALDKPKAAEHLYREALDQSRISLGEDHVGTLYRTCKFAGFLYRRKRLDEAVLYCEKALDGLIRVLGPDHPTTIGCKDFDRRLKAETEKGVHTDLEILPVVTTVELAQHR